MSYIMDTSEEGARVERKTDFLLTLEQLRWAGVRDGVRVLDLGCAGGTTCRVIAGLVGERGQVVGVDASAGRLEEGRKHVDHCPTIEYRQGDASHLPANDGEFDLSWSRFLFEYLTDPEAALSEMIRVTRSGGIVCVSDIDGNCIWHHGCNPALLSEVSAALLSIGNGFNPRIGLSLYTMAFDAGLRDLHVDVRPYHLIAGTIDAEKEGQWRMKLDGIRSALVARGWPSTRADALAAEFLSHLRDPRTFTYSSLITIRGTVP